ALPARGCAEAPPPAQKGATGFQQQGPAAHPPRRHYSMPQPRRRPALELLASSPDSCTEALMLANGFPVETLVELIRGGLASAEAERMIAGGKQIEVARLRITEAGRQALRL